MSSDIFWLNRGCSLILKLSTSNIRRRFTATNFLFDSLVKITLDLFEKKVSGTFNITTNQWITIGALKQCFSDLVEPDYQERLRGYFSQNDSEGLHVDTPPISDFFRKLGNPQRS